MLERRCWAWYAVLAAAISVSAFDYSLDRALQPVRIREHQEIIRGDAASPNRYRVLIPFAAEPLIQAIGRGTGYDEAFRLVYAAFYTAALFALMAALFRYLRLWFPADAAAIGVLLACCTLPMALRYHSFSPWSILEPLLLTMGLLAIHAGRNDRIPLLTVAASLNRETGVLIPIALLIDARHDFPRPTRRLSIAIAAIAGSLVIFGALRWWRGPAAPVVTIADVWRMNTSREGLRTAIPAVVLFLGGTGWLLAILGFGRAPRFVKRTTALLAVYLPAYLIFGYWYEVRLLMPLYPVLLPLALSSLYQPDDDPVRDR
jgi:hypothetical protein